MAFAPRPYLLANKIKHYAWGARGEGAFIPHLLGIEAEPDCPYAELWIGAHTRAPSAAILDGSAVPLPQLLAQYPLEILGEAVATEFSGSWPFLFKVLSAAEALSIQVHPSKEQARALHARDPEHYPDSNHKPELVVALDSLTALVGFKSLAAIRHTLEDYPELAGFIRESVCPELASSQELTPVEQGEHLRRMCSKLMRRSISHQEEMVRTVTRLSERVRATTDALSEEEQLFLNLEKKYTAADVGLLFIFLLNLVHLEEGEGLFIESGLPHAYLKGNAVECMANSDNVVRVGLTPKFKDAETLLQVLDYEPHPVSILKGAPGAERVIYRTPASEFQLSWWRLQSGLERQEAAGDRPGVFLMTKGEVLLTWDAGAQSGEQVLGPGQSVLIPAFLQEFKIRASHTAELFEVKVPL